jgi:hypothetical protein
LDPGVAAIDSRGGSSARTAVRLEYATIGWNVLEAAVAVGSGIVAGSLALVAFGLGSAIEVVSATVVLVHLRAVLAGLEPDGDRQRRARRTLAVTFFALAAYVSVDAVAALLPSDRPSASPLGLAVTATRDAAPAARHPWPRRHGRAERRDRAPPAASHPRSTTTPTHPAETALSRPIRGY